MTSSSAKAREEVRKAIRSAAARLPDLFAPGTKLVVGFSGGQDSTALLHALANSHRSVRIVAAHVDHALRSDSAESAKAVVASAEAIGVACQVRRVDVPAYRRSLRGWSTQQAARVARYQTLASVVEEHAAAALMVAHTADDQAETLLLHLLRGSGLHGLSAMRIDATLDPWRMGPAIGRVGESLRVARPLLSIARETTRAYCAHFGLRLVEDASNETRAYTRNRVRLDLLPALEQFNPAIRTVLARTADLAAEDDAALDAIVAELFSRLRRTEGYDLHLWRAQPRPLQRRLLRHALELVVGELVGVSDSPIEDALDVLQTGQPNQTYHLPYGVEVCLGSHAFTLRLGGRAKRPRVRKTWEVEGPRV